MCFFKELMVLQFLLHFVDLLHFVLQQPKREVQQDAVDLLHLGPLKDLVLRRTGTRQNLGSLRDGEFPSGAWNGLLIRLSRSPEPACLP